METRTDISLLLIGSSESGKSALLSQYAHEKFIENFTPTVASDYKSKDLDLVNAEIKLHIWDFAGREQYRSLFGMYARKTDIFLAVFDITDRDSFAEIESFLKLIKDKSRVILVGNKADLSFQRQVRPTESHALVAQHHLHTYIELSAKEHDAVTVLFDTAAVLANQKLRAAQGKPNLSELYLAEPAQPKKSKWSCCLWSCCRKPMYDHDVLPTGDTDYMLMPD